MRPHGSHQGAALPVPKVDLRANVSILPRMARNDLPARSLSPRWLLVPALACIALGAVWLYSPAPDPQRGAALYAQHCASCHGARLEGQPDWQIADENGTLPAPPHDETGHTWHHDDAMLIDYIRRGGQAVLDEMGVDMPSGMPGFEGTLSDGNIAAILAFIKSNWSPRIRAIQSKRNDR